MHSVPLHVGTNCIHASYRGGVTEISHTVITKGAEMSDETYEQRCSRWIKDAIHVLDFTGPVYCPWAGGPQEGYFESVDDLCEHLAHRDDDSGPSEWPPWAFCCEKEPITLDAETIFENAFDEWSEGVDHIPHDARTEFEAAVEKFNAAIKECIWIYRDDTKRRCRVPSREEWNAPSATQADKT